MYLVVIVEKKKTKSFYAAKIEKASKNQRNPMLFWESKLIHKMRGKSKSIDLCPLSKVLIRFRNGINQSVNPPFFSAEII